MNNEKNGPLASFQVLYISSDTCLISVWDCIKGLHHQVIANMSVRPPAQVMISHDNWIMTVQGNLRIGFTETLLNVKVVPLSG